MRKNAQIQFLIDDTSKRGVALADQKTHLRTLSKNLPYAGNMEQDSALHMQIRHTLAVHGIPPRQQASLVASLCDISPSQARRKLQGSAWLFEEIQTLAKFCGCAIESLTQTNGNTQSGMPQKANLIVEGRKLEGDMVIGKLLCPKDVATTPLVVMHVNGEWLIGTPSTLEQWQPGGPRYALERFSLTQARSSKKMHVAVLDDDHLAAQSLCDWLAHSELDATAFTSSAELLNADLMRFDAFIVDFILGHDQNATAAIEHIRRLRPEVPIALLTGRLKDGTTTEEDLTRMMRSQQVLFFEKPIRPALLTATLQNLFDRNAHGS